MADEATITITVDEYFDLRAKAEANMWLMRELGAMDSRFFEFDKRLREVETKVGDKNG